MAFELTSKINHDYIFIKSVGSVNNIEEYEGLLDMYVQLIKESGFSSSVVDELQLSFPNEQKFAIEVVDFQTKHFPFEFRSYKIANIANPDFLKLFMIWETSSQMKGFNSFKIFNDLDSATAWIINDS